MPPSLASPGHIRLRGAGLDNGRSRWTRASAHMPSWSRARRKSPGLRTLQTQVPGPRACMCVRVCVLRDLPCSLCPDSLHRAPRGAGARGRCVLRAHLHRPSSEERQSQSHPISHASTLELLTGSAGPSATTSPRPASCSRLSLPPFSLSPAHLAQVTPVCAWKPASSLTGRAARH